ncbi:MAG: DHH family phosphoesterase, partial [Spirochaetota bacterium]
MDGGRPLLVIGHRNPDTDSICSAIAYARYKREVIGEQALACRAGNINAQTRYALERFAAPDPRLVADVLPRIADIMIGRDALLLASPDQPLREAYEIIVRNRFSFLPVVDGEGRCVGRVTALGLAGLLGRLAEGSAPSVHALLDAPIRDELEPVGPAFPATTTIRDAERRVNQSNEGGFIVTDDDGAITGVVTRMSFMTDSRFRVALVDHNELSQSVEGIEHAAVEEIIDHHRIGMHRTSEPITVINRVVGSTCTIVADLFRQSGAEPSAETSGLLLSGLLSDTVILTSPTTTDLDRSLAPWLAGLARVGCEEYGRAMFAAGSEIGS